MVVRYQWKSRTSVLLLIVCLADSLGGDVYWAAGLSLISDIPKKPHWPVKLHGFVNAGRLDCVDQSMWRLK